MVGVPRIFQVISIGLVVVAAACVPAAAGAPAAPTHLGVATGLVLRLDDVKTGGFVTVDSALTLDDAVDIFGVPDITAEDFQHQQFINGYARAFAWRNGTEPITTLMASSTYLFADAEGAHETLSLFRAGGDAAGAGRLSLGMTIGDESAGFQIDRSLESAVGTITFTTTAIAFRHANALSVVTYRCLADEDDVAYEIGLARKQFDLQKAVAPAGIPILAKPAASGQASYGGSHISATGLVLDVADVPIGMRVRNEGPLSAVTFAAGNADAGASFEKHGFVSAYGRVFARGTQFGKEATVVRSHTAILADPAGAHEAFLELSDLAEAVGARKLGTGSDGDESRVFRLDDYEADASYVEILFRHRNALSLVEIQFPTRFINLPLSLELVRRQVAYQLADLGMLKPLH